MMEPALEDFTREVAAHEVHPPEVPYVSGVTGTWITAADATPDYWSRLLRGTVRFSDGLRTLGALDRALFLEVGPGRSLSTLARQHPELEQHATFSSLRSPSEDRTDREALVGTLSELWLHGVSIDWEAVHAGRGRRRVPLPGYPFERTEHWVPRSVRTEQRPASPAAPVEAPRDAQAEGLLPAPVPAPAMPLAPTVPGKGAPARELGVYLSQTINRMLGHDAGRALPGATVLGDLGVDSLVAIRLRAQLFADLDLSQSVKGLMAGTIDSLASELAARRSR